jgi:hypothetical protein
MESKEDGGLEPHEVENAPSLGRLSQSLKRSSAGIARSGPAHPSGSSGI